jgi:hypothetical protein
MDFTESIQGLQIGYKGSKLTRYAMEIVMTSILGLSLTVLWLAVFAWFLPIMLILQSKQNKRC